MLAHLLLLHDTLVGNTAVLWEASQAILQGLLSSSVLMTQHKPLLKGAFIEESVYIGDESLELLSALKTKNELIADIIAFFSLLPRTLLAPSNQADNKLSGIVKTLSEREEKPTAE